MDLKSSASVKTRNAANMKNLRTDVCLTKFYKFLWSVSSTSKTFKKVKKG